MLTVELPIYVTITRTTKKDKTISLTRNVWDNLHWGYKTSVKKIIADLTDNQLKDRDPINGLISVYMKLWVKRTDSDLSNWCDVVTKIAQDRLTELGLIDDDCVKVIVHEERLYMGVDKNNPRIEITWSKYGMERSRDVSTLGSEEKI